MKIKKNLSDEEMFKGYVEKESFENAFDADEKIVSSKMKNKWFRRLRKLRLPV